MDELEKKKARDDLKARAEAVGLSMDDEEEEATESGETAPVKRLLHTFHASAFMPCFDFLNLILFSFLIFILIYA